MKYILSLIISGTLVVSGFGQTRNVLVGTNNAVVQPTNFWSADAANARAGLGLGSVATNSSAVFQPSSLVLSNLASSNGFNLTNIPISGVVGALATNGNATNLTNFPANLLRTNGSAAGLTNITAANIAGTVALASNLSSPLALTNGGTGATNSATARTNLGATTIGNSLFTATNAQSAFDALGIGTNLSTSVIGVSNIQVSSFPSGSGLGFIIPTSGQTINVAGTNLTTAVPAFFGWNGFFQTAFSAAEARTNIGLTLLALTNTNNTDFRNAIGLGITNVVRFGGIQLYQDGEVSNSITYTVDTLDFNQDGSVFLSLDSSTGGTVIVYRNIAFGGTNSGLNASQTRTNFGLPWTGLTNTNAATFQAALFGSNTNPVLVNTNGEVVSPTNFWGVAPISTTVQYQTNVTGTSTNAATNSRNLFLFSLAPSVSGVTNTVALPTNPATTFEGDRATITHLAQTTNAVTAVRQLGAATNLITLNQLDETILLMYRSGAWRLADNISYVEPIFFSGTNAAANAAASRTNLGLGVANDVQFKSIFINGVFNTLSNAVEIFQPILITDRDSTNSVFQFETESDIAIARTNLKIPLAALTNTNNTDFQAAVLNTNAAPTNSANVNTVNFNTAVAWMEVHVFTNGSNTSFRIPLFK
jgi:hypothetical protein